MYLPSLELVEEYSFHGNEATTIHLPKLLNINDGYSFSNCYNLRIFIALKLKNIAPYCFCDCN